MLVQQPDVSDGHENHYYVVWPTEEEWGAPGGGGGGGGDWPLNTGRAAQCCAY